MKRSMSVAQADRRLVISVHDVMPETLDATEAIVERLTSARLDTVTLLVVPGRDWSSSALDRLRVLLNNGAIAAGHGWTHRAASIRGPYHRLHSALISRNAAEHLALDAEGLRELIRRCHAWFVDQELGAPLLYVPPAWAMGALSFDDLDRLPFARYEVLGGVYDVASGRFSRSPMVGFEADTALRAVGCRIWNRLNLLAAGRDRPVRLAIHPGDFGLRLAADLERLIDAGGEAMSYDVFARPDASDVTAPEPRADSQ